MHSMSAFMNHRGYIMHLSGGIHENKRGAGFGKRTVISSGCFTYPTLKIKAIHFLHRQQAVCEEWSEVTEAFYSFFQQLIPRPKWIQWLLISGLSIHIPGL